jgi:hypothetical protein
MQGIFIFFSCKKDIVPMFTNSSISGYADIHQSNGENANIQVIASGPYGMTIAKTGDGGHYMISGLGNGTYRLDFSKEGYGTIKMFNVQLFGNDTVYESQVILFKKYDKFQLPLFTKVSLTSNQRFGPNPTVIIETSMSIYEGVLPSPLPVVLFIDTVKSVSYKSYASAYSILFPAFADSGEGKIDFIFNPAYLPYKKGTEVYFIAYVANPDEIQSGYFDKYLGIEQLSTLIPEKHSQVFSFIMP